MISSPSSRRCRPDRQDHRQPAEPRAHAAEGHQVARQALRKDARFLRRAGALHRRRRGQARRAGHPDHPRQGGRGQAAPEDDQVMKAQELRDLRAARDDLERRVHDLKLTRQVTMQSLPSIRLVQENDKSLVTKINSTLVNTVPLWETQLAQAVTIQRSTEAAKAVREATDLTNELLTANAENLREATTAWSARRWSAACSTSRRQADRQCRPDRHDRAAKACRSPTRARPPRRGRGCVGAAQKMEPAGPSAELRDTLARHPEADRRSGARSRARHQPRHRGRDRAAAALHLLLRLRLFRGRRQFHLPRRHRHHPRRTPATSAPLLRA
jgi:hypothetical protein